MTKSHVVGIVLGILLYYAYLKFKGVIGGNPLNPMPAAKG
jgi:hypothetical protein